MIRALAILLCLQVLGESLALVSHLPVPGRLVGMLLLFALLLRWPGLEAAVAPMGKALLATLPLLFVPAAVGVMAYADRLHREGVAIAIALVLSAVCGLIATATVARVWMRAGQDRHPALKERSR